MATVLNTTVQTNAKTGQGKSGCGCGGGGGGDCCCPACTGLTPFERPLFATGQTLTAADLTALQSYVAGKNRLHNRYLHGWGVVCGLDLVCNDCDGSVTIRPGYAIDPCGADIVVSQALRFDVVKAIRDCTGSGRARTGDCDPWAPPSDPGCEDALGYWCVSLRYREVETAIGQRLTTGGGCSTLGRHVSVSNSSGGCGCGGGCGGGGSSGSCGCHGGTVTSTVNAAAATTTTASNSCAPRRVSECFEVGLVRTCEPCAPTLGKLKQSLRNEKNALGLFDWLIPKRTLLRNIIDCVKNDIEAVTKNVGENDWVITLAVGLGDPEELANSEADLDTVHGAICRTRAAVVNLLASDEGSTRCQLARAASQVTLVAPQSDQISRQAYFEMAKEAASELLAAWLQTILDCVCRAFLPPCPPDPCDERVEIACLTVKNGKIIDICNHSCRHYAGAFPSTFYWMSLIPLVPLFARLLAMLCCQPDLLRRNSPLVNDLSALLGTVDPTGKLAAAVVADDFATPRRYLAALARVSDTPVIPALSARLDAAVSKNRMKTGEKAAAATQDDVASLRAEIAELRAGMVAMQVAAPAEAVAVAARAPAKAAVKATAKPLRKGG